MQWRPAASPPGSRCRAGARRACRRISACKLARRRIHVHLLRTVADPRVHARRACWLLPTRCVDASQAAPFPHRNPPQPSSPTPPPHPTHPPSPPPTNPSALRRRSAAGCVSCGAPWRPRRTTPRRRCWRRARRRRRRRAAAEVGAAHPAATPSGRGRARWRSGSVPPRQHPHPPLPLRAPPPASRLPSPPRSAGGRGGGGERRSWCCKRASSHGRPATRRGRKSKRVNSPVSHMPQRRYASGDGYFAPSRA
jgi:hypothetical protein